MCPAWNGALRRAFELPLLFDIRSVGGLLKRASRAFELRQRPSYWECLGAIVDVLGPLFQLALYSRLL